MNKNTFIYLLIIPLLLLLADACKKKHNDINFSGRVINPGNNQAVSDAKVTIASTSVQSWVYNSNFQDIETTNSGHDGGFSFNFANQAANAYRIYIFKNNYFTNTTVINATEVTPEEPYFADFELIPEAMINLNIKNTSPLDSADRILFKILRNTVSCINCCPQGYIEGKGPTFDTTIVCKTYGDMYFVVESNITKGTQTEIRRDSVFMTPFESSGLNIFY